MSRSPLTEILVQVPCLCTVMSIGRSSGMFGETPVGDHGLNGLAVGKSGRPCFAPAEYRSAARHDWRVRPCGYDWSYPSLQR